MSGEYRDITIGLTIRDYEQLPEKDGVQMYADDVVEEFETMIEEAIVAWYKERGVELLVIEPTV